MILYFATFAIVGLLMIGLAIPMVQRRIAPNALYGLRVPATFASETVWYEANARSGKDLIFFGVGQLLLAAVLFPLGLEPETYALSNAAYSLAGALTCGYVGWRRANLLLAAEQADGSPA